YRRKVPNWKIFINHGISTSYSYAKNAWLAAIHALAACPLFQARRIRFRAGFGPDPSVFLSAGFMRQPATFQ
ncbi:MAG: hypothetical protein OXH94_12345, partial [Rhodospirillales bacterium]|nr:hypothetical protein [Rhodospirillales bacterium]